MDYKGQIHTALSDSYNTARILHKLFCTKSLDLDFEYINPSKECPIIQKEEWLKVIRNKRLVNKVIDNFSSAVCEL